MTRWVDGASWTTRREDTESSTMELDPIARQRTGDADPIEDHGALVTMSRAPCEPPVAEGVA
jgi:hypothetical protein